VLPTVFFVLGAYGVYALYAVGLDRQGRRLRLTSKSRNFWLARGLAWLGLGLLFWFLIQLSPRYADHRIKLAGILGSSVMEEPAAVRVEPQPVSQSLPRLKPSKQPAYALLHPETPPVHLTPPPKTIRPRARVIHRAKMKSVTLAPAKKNKAVSQVSRKAKDKGTAKSRNKRKKAG